MAHAQQYSTLDRDSLNVEGALQLLDHKDNVYDIPGTIEYDAHTVREPALRRKNWEAKLKDHDIQRKKAIKEKKNKGLLGRLKGFFD
jgi:hypothetical protein